MTLSLSWREIGLRLARLRSLAASPPPPPEVFLRRIRFLERGVGLPVKAVLMVVLTFYLFFSSWGDEMTLLQQEVLGYTRMFFLLYFALNVGNGLILWGMDEVSVRLVVPLTCCMAILDGAMLGLLTLVSGGFESYLYWAFLGLIVRNAAVIPNADVQITANVLVSLCYLLGGFLDIWVARAELELIQTMGRGTVGGGSFEEAGGPGTELLVLRMLLLVFHLCMQSLSPMTSLW